MNRREFLGKGLIRTLYAICAFAIAYPISAFVFFKKSREKMVRFRPAKGRHVILYKEGVFLVSAGGKLLALSARCTHLGCTINYDPVCRGFRCPCHGSRFDLSGKRVAGPARKPLRKLPIKRQTNGDIVVTTTY